MIDVTYDPEADAVYLRVAKGQVAETHETGPFIYDTDVEGRVLGIEILFARDVLAPGNWLNARLPGSQAVDAAE